MRALKIEVVLKENKITTGIKTIGFSKDDITNQFAIIGILENIKDIVKSRIEKLAEMR